MSSTVDAVLEFSDEAFPNAHSICAAFFARPESNAQNWTSLETLVDADDVTFWTVVAAHPKLAQVIDQLIRAVDESHATSSKQHRVPRTHERWLIQFLVRMMTTLVSASKARRYTTSSVARRLSRIVPSTLLLPVSLMLLRSGGPIASTSIASFLLLSPLPLTHFSGIVATWYDAVSQIAAKCVSEGKRGRFQRRGGDVLPLLERSFRLTKHVWALVHTAPYLVVYSDIHRLVIGLRVLVDVVSPLLQHFIMTADELAARRPLLTKANAMIINAAVCTATLAVLFYPVKVESKSDVSKKPTPPPVAIGEDALKSFDESCSAYLTQYCGGNAASLVERNRRLRDILHQIRRPPTFAELSASVDTDDLRLHTMLEWAHGPIPNSNDFSGGICEGEERFGQCVILELVNQGFDIRTLHTRGFLTAQEVTKWNGDQMESRSAPAPPTAAPSHSGPSQPSEVVETGDPMIDMVLGILPHLSPEVVHVALDYYNGNVEQLINEALSGNLPPHLQESAAATAAPLVPTSVSAAPPIAAPPVAPPTYDDMAPQGDMERFLSSHYVEQAADDVDEDITEYDRDMGMGEGMLSTLHAFSSTASETLYLDDGYRKHSFEFLYEDERDDGQDGEAHVWGAVGRGDSSSDDEDDLRPLNRHPPAQPAPQHRAAVATAAADGDTGRGRGGSTGTSRGRGRGGRGAGANGAAVAAPGTGVGERPAYAVKKTKERKAGGGGAKSALMRSVKKSGGGYD